MKRGLLSAEFIRDSHDCAIALRRSLVANLSKPAPDARMLPAKDATKPCDEFVHPRMVARFFERLRVGTFPRAAT